MGTVRIESIVVVGGQQLQPKFYVSDMRFL